VTLSPLGMVVALTVMVAGVAYFSRTGSERTRVGLLWVTPADVA
jgi:hypothetical protein